MQGGAKLKYQLGAESGKRQEPQLVQNDEILVEGAGQEFGQPVLFLSQDEFVNQRGRIIKTNPLPLPARGQSQPGRNVTFSSTINIPP